MFNVRLAPAPTQTPPPPPGNPTQGELGKLLELLSEAVDLCTDWGLSSDDSEGSSGALTAYEAAAVEKCCDAYLNLVSKINDPQQKETAITDLVKFAGDQKLRQCNPEAIKIIYQAIIATDLASLEHKNAAQEMLDIEANNIKANDSAGSSSDSEIDCLAKDYNIALSSYTTQKKQAVLIFERAAAAGHIPSMIFLGEHYEKQYNSCTIKYLNQSLYKQALGFFQNAAEQNSIDGKIGVLRMKSGEGDVNARNELGMLYLVGNSALPIDIHAAEYHLKIAADAFYGPAALTLARLYSEPKSALKAGAMTVRKYFDIAEREDMQAARRELKSYNTLIEQLSSPKLELPILNQFKVRKLPQKSLLDLAAAFDQYCHYAEIALINDEIKNTAKIGNELLELIITYADLKFPDSPKFVIDTALILKLATLFEDMDNRVKAKLSILGHTDQYIKNSNACYKIAHESRKDLQASIMILKIEADQGNPKSQYLFGVQCELEILLGTLAQFNGSENALGYFQMAAKQGHVGASFKMAMHFLSAQWLVINQNEEITRHYLNRVNVNRASYRDALFNCAEKYKLTDPQKAQLCYEKAGELGHEVAKYIALMRKANGRDTVAQYEFGLLCFNQSLPNDAVFNMVRSQEAGYNYLLQAADKKHGDAALIVANGHSEKWNCIRNASDKLAGHYYKIAVERKAEGAKAAYNIFLTNQQKAKLEQMGKVEVSVTENKKPIKSFDLHEDL